MELRQLVVTEGLYFLDEYCFSIFEVDSQVITWSVWRYCRLLPFFEHIQQVVIFLRDRVPYLLVLVLFLVCYRQLGANVDSFQLDLVVDFIPS